MRETHVVAHSAGSIVLRPSILRALQLQESCELYAALIRDHTTNEYGDNTTDHSIVLSYIPPQFWDRSYRITLVTSSQRNSLATICTTLTSHNIRLLRVYSTGASLQGDLHTSIVATDEREVHSPKHFRQDLNECRKSLIESGALSGSGMFGDHTNLLPMFEVKLKYLSGFANPSDTLEVLTGPTRVGLNGSVLDLASIPYEDTNIYDWLVAGAKTVAAGTRATLLMTDSEESLIRLWIIPPEIIRAFEFEYNVTRKSIGESMNTNEYLSTILSTFADSPLHVNVFHSEHHTIASKTSRNKLRETARVKIVGDTSRSVDRDSNVTLENRAERIVNNELKKRAADLDHASAKVVRDTFFVSPLHMMQMPVFVATNVKSGIGNEYLNMALQLVQALKTRRLYPVNVEIADSPNLRDEILGVLAPCPMFISFHVPEAQNKLVEPRKDSGFQCGYSASAWVLFEEAVALSESNRSVFRLRHEEVMVPAFDAAFRPDDTFRDKQTFDVALSSLMSRIDALLSKRMWRKRSDLFARRVAIDQLDLHKRNLEDWLCKQLELSVKFPTKRNKQQSGKPLSTPVISKGR